MAKYYVTSGGLEAIVTDDDPADAAKRALWQNDQEKFPEALGLICKISETGFESENDQDLFMATGALLAELGIEYEMNEETQDLLDDIENEIKGKGSFDEDEDEDEDEEELI